MRTFTKIALLLGLATALLSWGAAKADWNPGDSSKMLIPQLPDPTGWDVNMAQPKVLADDFLCIESGPISDIHFWFSIRQDNTLTLAQFLNGGVIHTSIHSDVPAGVDGPYSHPGDLLWERDFLVGPTGSADFVSIRPWPESGPQGWYDPNTGEANRPDHFQMYQANIVGIVAPYVQQAGRIYWLDLSVNVPGIGWKTSLEHFNDDAVWGDIAGPIQQWNELRDPLTGQSLDLAFVITPEPGVCLVGICVAGLLLIRRRGA